jgi:NIMA (never in mitosis gene a)-related kinase
MLYKETLDYYEALQYENTNCGKSLEDFKIIGELGRGSYGLVYKVVSKIDNNIYVLKKLDLKHMKEKQQKEAWKEAMILKKLNNPNIIK